MIYLIRSYLLLCCGLFFLVALAQDEGLENLTPVTGDRFEINSERLNCIAHELSAPGQGLHASGSGLHASGSVGGFTASPPTSSIRPFDSPDLAAFPLGQMSESATILVADEFNDIYKLGREITTLTTIDKAILQGLLDSPSPAISHGALVMSHVNALVHGTGRYTLASVSSSGDEVTWEHAHSGKQLIVRAVEVTDGSGAIDPQKIVDALPGSDFRVVVNMSFVLLPCAVLEDFIDSDIDTFDVYLEELALENGSDLETIRQVVSTPLDDGFEGIVDEFSGWVSFVASSGNFGFGFQMFPAAWESVIGVSASQAMGTASPMRANFSNAGQVMATGAWFSTAELCQIEALCASSSDPMGERGQLAYAGTSFAAPSMSVAAALFDSCHPSTVAFDETDPSVNDTPLDEALNTKMVCD